MREKIVKVYKYDELSQEAKEKARMSYNSTNDFPFLKEELEEVLNMELKKAKIEEYKSNLYYSLSYNQGNGTMFEGKFYWKGYSVEIKHRGHYYHNQSKEIEISDDNGYTPEQYIYEEFEKIYCEICDRIEDAGYKQIEYEESEENFKETCEANNYEFTEDGEMA